MPFALRRALAPAVTSALLAASTASAQPAPSGTTAATESELGTLEGIEDLNLDDLMGLEVTVASLKAMSLRESPGIVSVITRDELQRSGARDLIDVLRNVPGFFVGTDVQGVVGLGLRGNWAHEGKVLLIVDGLEQNEPGYQTLQLGHHYPIEAIDRIEIIRGPGSAIYGGSAMLGVIKVTTRDGAKVNGVRASARYGAPRGFFGGKGDTTGFVDGTVEAGAKHGDLTWNVTAMAGRSVRGDGTYTSLEGTSYELGKASDILPLYVSGSVQYKGHQLRLSFDDYKLRSRDGFGTAVELIEPYSFRGIFADYTAKLDLAPGLKLLPRVSYRNQRSYFTETDDPTLRQQLIDQNTWSQRNYQRALASLAVSWDFFRDANLVVGVESFYDHARGVGDSAETQPIDFFGDDTGAPTRPTLEFLTVAGFAQVLWPTEWVNFTVGGRVEGNTGFGVSAVPRLALTRVFENGLHVKLLAAQAFRMPSVNNKSLEKVLSADGKITPERTTVFEAELGWTLDERFSASINGFYTGIQDPIIYSFDEMLMTEFYANRASTQTAGAELELRSRLGKVKSSLSYAFYAALGERVPEYEVPGQSVLLGAPQHKLAARVSAEVLPKVFVTPTFALLAGRWAYTAASPDAPIELGVEPILDLAITAEDVGGTGLELGLIAHDLLDHTDQFPQPYAGGHTPLFGRGRMVMARVAFAYGR